MKKTWLWFAVSTAAFLLLVWGWVAAPIDYDMSEAMFSGILDTAIMYMLYLILGWLIGAVKYLLAAGYALTLFVILQSHPKRFMITLLIGAALTALGVLGLAGISFWGWYFTRWVMPFVAALFTSGLLIILLSFVFRLPGFAHLRSGTAKPEAE